MTNETNERGTACAEGRAPAIAAARVMLLTSSLGSGHLRAAQAIEAALRERVPDAVVQTLDFWSLLDARVAHILRQNYLRLVQERPELYERIYRLDQRIRRDTLERGVALPLVMVEALAWLIVRGAEGTSPGLDGGRRTLDRAVLHLLRALLVRRATAAPVRVWRRRLATTLLGLGWARLARRLHARLEAFDADVVVATEMNAAALFSFVKMRHGLAVPALGVLTDFGIHDFWRQPGIDRYCVPHPSIAAQAGAGSERMEATGIPLMPGFRDPPSPAEARERLQLDAHAPVALVLGGGLGLGVEAVAARLLEGAPGIQLLVMEGRNAPARDALNAMAKRYPGRLFVCGWSERMEEFMRAADVVVGKPGGLTLAEALACGRPLLATRSLCGQESFNIRFLEQHGVGQLVPEDELVARIESLLANRGELARIQQRAWTLGKRDAAARIAESVLAAAQARSRDEVKR